MKNLINDFLNNKELARDDMLFVLMDGCCIDLVQLYQYETAEVTVTQYTNI